mmetsp:Transcript_3920/g.10019  ORF Transcript_3920/g.10019 Transcript_3920/m.10019 type:complete len:555 (-) Transcript_3920:313-1977(-)
MAWPWRIDPSSDGTSTAQFGGLHHRDDVADVGRVPCDSSFTDLLTSQVYALGEAVLQHDHELRELRQEITSAPAELSVFTEENAILAGQAQEGLEEAAALSAAQASLASEAEKHRQRVQDLQAERDTLQARVAIAEQLVAKARNSSDWTSRALDVERCKSKDWERDFEAESEQRHRRVVDAEASAAAAARNLARMEADLAASRVELSTASLVSAAETERRQQQEVGLEESIGEAHERRRALASRERELGEELRQERAEELALQHASDVLSTELVESERVGEETERKALSVARELLETSQSMARLRSEVAAQRSLDRELEDAQREEGVLEQQLAKAEMVAASHLKSSRCTGSSGRDTRPESRDGVSQPDGTAAWAAPVAAAESAAQSAQTELREMRASQERALTEALRAAWEAEARDHRATELELEAAEAQWLPLREWIVRLAAVTQRGSNDLVAPRCGVAAQQLGCATRLHNAASLNCAQLADALAALCDSVEELSAESARRLELSRRFSNARAAAVPATPRGFWANPLTPDAGAMVEVSSLSASSQNISLGHR